MCCCCCKNPKAEGKPLAWQLTGLHFGIYRPLRESSLHPGRATEITVPTTQRDSDYKPTLMRGKSIALGWAASLISLHTGQN